jgi:HK97 family phage prohead protease
MLSKASIRKMQGEGNERKFILSFSSEEPYTRWWGVEILDHSDGAVDLTRLNEIGCLLFNHDRDEVLGKINRAWIENERGMAEVEFDSDDKAEVIYQKVKSGTLKGVSVGYVIDSWEEVMANKQSSDGKFTGPCDIARKWTPYEISIVSVPADPTVGVGRSYENVVSDVNNLDFYERQLQININNL